MTIKITALLISVSVALMYVLSTLYPNDPYFYLISSNIAAAFMRMILAGVLVHLAFKNKFRTAYGHIAAYASAAVLILFGLSGLGIAPLDYSLFNYLKPLDYVYMIGCGFMFAYAGLAYEQGKDRLPRLSRPRNTQLRIFSTSASS